MKKIYLLSFLSFLLYSCSKSDSLNPSEGAELTHIVSVDTNQVVTTTSFEYDDEGRIVLVSHDRSPDITQFTYLTNEIRIRSRSDRFNYDYDIRYLLNSEGKPILRLEHTESKEGDSSTLIYYNHNFDDTTYYHYDADGLIVSSNRVRHSSNWSVHSLTREVQSGKVIDRYESQFTHEGKKLTELIINHRATDSTGLPFELNYESKYVFYYDKGYLNKIDHKNLFVLSELLSFDYGMEKLYYYSFPLNMNYPDIPNTIKETAMTKDQQGTVLYSWDYTTNTEMTVYENGLLKTVHLDVLYQNPVTLHYK